MACNNGNPSVFGYSFGGVKMIRKFKNVFFFLIAACFMSTALMANQNDILNLFSKIKYRKIAKIEKRKNFCKKDNRNSNSSKNELPIGKIDCDYYSMPNFEYEMGLSDIEIFLRIFNSKFGYSMTLKNQQVTKNEKEIFLGCKSIMNLLDDFEKSNSVTIFIYLNDPASAENVAKNISSDFNEYLALEYVFSYYVLQKDLKNAERILPLMAFYHYDCDPYYDTHNLILAYLLNKDFESAERIAESIDDEHEKNIAFLNLAKYYAKLNDIKNVNFIINKISDDEYKDLARLYLLDAFAKCKNITEFHKLAFSSNSIEFLKSAKFILALYENNLEEAKNNQSINYELILENFIENLCFSSKIKEAEDLINIFCSEDEKEDYLLFLINAYLKNNNFEEAKRLKNNIQDDFFNKRLVSELISNYSKK
jgi:hypothetical protein